VMDSHPLMQAPIQPLQRNVAQEDAS
jgi:nitrous oxidase accessory protein